MPREELAAGKRRISLTKMLYPPAVNIESSLEELTLKTLDARGCKSVDVVYPRRNK